MNLTVWFVIFLFIGETDNVVQDEPLVRPRPGLRAQNRTLLRRNNRNVIRKFLVYMQYLSL